MPPPPARNRALGWLRAISAVLLVAVIITVAVITFRQSPPDPEGQRELSAWLRRAHLHGLPEWITLAVVEFAANVVMFAPIGFFGALVFRRRHWLIVPIAAAASVVIEIYQALRLPERVGSVGDVVANTLGATIGLLLAMAVVVVLNRRTARSALARPIDVDVSEVRTGFPSAR